MKFRFDDIESWAGVRPPFGLFAVVAGAGAMAVPFSNSILGEFIQWLIQSLPHPPSMASMAFSLRSFFFLCAYFGSLANAYTHFVMT